MFLYSNSFPILFQAWRDHWMQAIYYPISKPDPCDKMFLTSNHDEYSYWFDISTEKPM